MADETTTNTEGVKTEGVEDVGKLKSELSSRDKMIADMKSKIDKLNDDIKTTKSKSDTDKAAADGALKDLLGKTQEELKAAEKARTDMQAKLEAFDKRDRDAADELFKKLPEPKQKELGIVKDALDTQKWLALVQAAASTAVETPAPVIPKGGDKNPTPKARYKPKHGEVIAEHMMGVDPALPWVSRMEVTTRDGRTSFQLPTREFIQVLKDRALKGVRISPSDKK